MSTPMSQEAALLILPTVLFSEAISQRYGGEIMVLDLAAVKPCSLSIVGPARADQD